MYWRIRSQKTLALDVWEHASSAALEDYRFYPVRPEEVPQLHIEISRLTIPVALDYDSPEELPRLLHPNVDGVVLREGWQRATCRKFGRNYLARRVSFASMPENERSRRPVAAEEAAG